MAQLRVRYQAAAEALERVWLEELAGLSDRDALARTLSLRLFTSEPIPARDSSGLVEQQSIFHRRTRS